MGKSTNFLVICAVLVVTHITVLSSTAVHASSGVHQQLSWIPATSSAPACRGSMAECLGDEDELGLGLELEMDSEINRRILAVRGRYISYGALSRNSVPCSRRGASYYNCRQGAQANPYSRGCSAITRCRR